MLENPASNHTLLDYWEIIWRARLIITGLVLASTIVTGILTILSTKLYEAKATLLPAREESMGGGISFGSGKDKSSGGGSASLMVDAITDRAGGPTALEIFNILLRSRRMAEAVVEQLNLMEYYGTTSMSAAVNALTGETVIRPSPWKSMEIIVLSRDPKMAANIANAFVLNLDRLNKELTITATKRGRLFVEARLAEKTKKLEEAEEALKAFQTEHHIMFSEGAGGKGSEGPMGAAISLHGDIVGLEIELAALKEYALPSHPMINQMQAKIDELRRQLDKLEQDQTSRNIARRRTRPPLSQKVFPLVEEAPSIALDLLRLARRVKIEEAVYGMLVGSLEAARLAEAKDLPTIQPLDVAKPPEYPNHPRPLQNVQVAAGVSLFLGIMVAIFIDYLQRLKARRTTAILPQPVLDDLALTGANGNGDKAQEFSAPSKKTEQIRG